MKIGCHTSVKGAYYNGMVDGQELGCETVQIFTSNPRGWAFRQFKEGEVEAFHAKRAETGLTPVFAHALYLINAATPDPTLQEKSLNALLEEIQRIDTLGMEFVVLHPGSYKDTTLEEGLQHIIDALTWVFEQTPNGTGKIAIENTAGQGSLLGCKFEEIKQILDGMPVAWQGRVGMCFDTCHAFASGYDFRTREQYEDMIALLDEVIGLNHVCAFHLNDCAEDFASNRDLHAHIGDGCIGQEPFAYFLNDPAFREVPGVLETDWGPKYTEVKKDIATLFSMRET